MGKISMGSRQETTEKERKAKKSKELAVGKQNNVNLSLFLLLLALLVLFCGFVLLLCPFAWPIVGYPCSFLALFSIFPSGSTCIVVLSILYLIEYSQRK